MFLYFSKVFLQQVYNFLSLIHIFPVEELSSLCDTINYETVCLIGKRVPRIYYQNGQIVGELDYICP